MNRVRSASRKYCACRPPFVLKRLPLLARLYLKAYYESNTRWRLRFWRLLLRLLLPCCPRVEGEFEFQRFGQSHRIRFNAKNFQFATLYSPLFREGYEPEVCLLMELLLPPRATFLDIGSNWGYFSLYAAGLREEVQIHAFEPFPASYQDLTECVRQAGLAQVITCRHLALSNFDGEANISLPDGLHSGWAEINRDSVGFRVQARRLDGLNLPAPDLIKMDVEGHEAEVLRGARETLNSARPFIIFENKASGAPLEKALEPLFLLEEFGYRIYAPALWRKHGEHRHYRTDYSLPPLEDDRLVLFHLRPEERLLWGVDLNLVACHTTRESELLKHFELVPAVDGRQ